MDMAQIEMGYYWLIRLVYVCCRVRQSLLAWPCFPYFESINQLSLYILIYKKQSSHDILRTSSEAVSILLLLSCIWRLKSPSVWRLPSRNRIFFDIRLWQQCSSNFPQMTSGLYFQLRVQLLFQQHRAEIESYNSNFSFVLHVAQTRLNGYDQVFPGSIYCRQLRLLVGRFSILVDTYLVVRLGVQCPIHLEKPTLLLFAPLYLLLTVPMKIICVVAIVEDCWQIRKCGSTILVFSKLLQLLFHLGFVVVGHFFRRTVVEHICRYIFPLVEGARRQVVSLAMRVYYTALIVVQTGLLKLFTESLGELEGRNLFHLQSILKNRKFMINYISNFLRQTQRRNFLPNAVPINLPTHLIRIDSDTQITQASLGFRSAPADGIFVCS